MCTFFLIPVCVFRHGSNWCISFFHFLNPILTVRERGFSHILLGTFYDTEFFFWEYLYFNLPVLLRFFSELAFLFCDFYYNNSFCGFGRDIYLIPLFQLSINRERLQTNVRTLFDSEASIKFFRTFENFIIYS